MKKDYDHSLLRKMVDCDVGIRDCIGMKKSLLLLIPTALILSACSSGPDTEAIKATEEYATVSNYWDTFPSSWEGDVCGEIAGPDDKAGTDKAINVMKLMLKVNLSIETDITKDDAYSAAIRVLLSENC
jgi:hypothetical protein